MKSSLPPLGTTIIGRTSAGRPIVRNDDGSVSTERTETVDIDGRWYNVPTMFGGQAVSVEDAIQRVKAAGFKDPDTGEALTMHPSLDAALLAAQRRSAELAKDPMVQQALEQSAAGQYGMTQDAAQRRKRLPSRDVQRAGTSILRELTGGD